MEWEGWTSLAAIAAVSLSVIWRLVTEAQGKGSRMAKDEQREKDIDGIGRKVENVRRELRAEIAEVRDEHDELRKRVDEIATTVSASHALLGVMNTTLNMLVQTHSKETNH